MALVLDLNLLLVSIVTALLLGCVCLCDRLCVGANKVTGPEGMHFLKDSPHLTHTHSLLDFNL